MNAEFAEAQRTVENSLYGKTPATQNRSTARGCVWPVDEFARAGEAYYRSCKTEVGDDGLEPPTSGEFEVVFVLFAQPVDGGKPFVLDYKAARFVVGDDAGDDHN